MISFLPLNSLSVVVEAGDPAGDCLAVRRFTISGEGAELMLAPASFARFVVAANLGEATGQPGAWEDVPGKPLAVSILIHAERKVLVLRRKNTLAIQSGVCTASVTGTVEVLDAGGENALLAAALRELREEAGLSEADGTLSFRGLALAPGKAQPVGLFEFACRRSPGEVLASVLAWPRFAEEHVAAEFLEPARTLNLPLSPVSRLAVELFRSGVLPDAASSTGDREREALRRLSVLDPLTELLNRLGFRKNLEEALAGTGRAAVVLFDVDGLKLVNDRYGHGAGDEVLRFFASILSGTARKWSGATTARTGGDEFAVLLPGAGLTESEEFARSVVDDSRLETAPAAKYLPHGAIRAGWGVAVFPDDAADPERLLAAADSRLKESKARRGSFSLALAAALSRYGDSLSLDEAEAVFGSVLALADRVEPGLRAHCLRVGRLVRAVAEEMSLPEKQIRLAHLAGKFHDIGKLGVGPAVLQKGGPLTAEERLLAEKHPVAGAEMLGSVWAMVPVAEAVRHHHERWDGRGYPDGLKEEEIPLLARVVALADAWDTMAAGRHYQAALPWGKALRHIMTAAGSQFDPRVVEVLVKLVKRKEKKNCAQS
ncbi:diguanylate cyclase [Desulfofundulus sp. TPOSR]|uniref:HD domain-containing phosphohydrolase n=1 Tax=Desulfofundulus sp. TPOSR TaxID=2714340 RepID=UPI00140925C3|nr:HD domain-containing phosphohydrolase [Desulfofundulus sp. TPOSR]NHM28145.1 diguanylate cyclase [Desulfofundulus sp. TPOSR]